MKNGILIYDEEGAKRNQWFINTLLESAKDYNLNLRLVIFKNMPTFLFEDNIDFAINRVISPKLTYKLEKRGIKVFNNYMTSLIANDKWKTFKLCKKLNIPVMNTKKISKINKKTIKNFPVIAKCVDGHGGSQVFLVNNLEELKSLSTLCLSNKKYFILQEPCSDKGIDVRMYVLNGKIISSVLRRSLTDFRSNFSLGGDIELFTPTKAQVEIVDKLCNKLKCDFVGVDFIYHDNDWVLNEIEDVVGTRMLYKLTDILPHQLLLNHISNILE